MILTTPSQRRALLQRSHTVAMIGASANPLRPSYTVFSYLRTQTPFALFPINPTIKEIDGVPAFASLRDFAVIHGAPDIVDVFRRPSELVSVVREAIAVGAKAIWFQYGVINDVAVSIADDAGLDIVVDRCMKVEYARFHGGLSTTGLNSGLITSKLPTASPR
jgi:predicted CoA-binding protein